MKTELRNSDQFGQHKEILKTSWSWRGYHHWAHFLLRVLSSTCGLGPVTPGKLQEAGVKGASSLIL